jgi:hypothetical protein
VTGSVVHTLITGAAVCLLGLLLGFSRNADALDWLAAIGLHAALGKALSWLTVAFGLLAKTLAGANSLSLVLLVLPFVSSAFAPTATMLAGVRAFADTSRSPRSSTPFAASSLGRRWVITVLWPSLGLPASPWLDSCGR